MGRALWLVAVAAAVLAVTARAEEPNELPVARVIRQINFPRGQSGGNGGQQGCHCSVLVNCAAELEQINGKCRLPRGIEGVCCPARTLASLTPSQGKGDNKILPSSRLNVGLRSLNQNMVNAACQKGINTINNQGGIERNLINNRVVLHRGSPAAAHLRVFIVSDQAKRMDKSAQAIIEASKNIVNDFQLSTQQGGHGLKNLQVATTQLAGECPQNPRCNFNAVYRTADGSCNNQRQPTWGMSSTPTQRILPPTYDDGVSSPRSRNTQNGPLPNVRVITNNILVDVNNPDEQYTSSLMQWAQFLDHDFAHIPFPSLPNGDGIECCPNGREATGSQRHPRCLPIDITGDPFFNQFNSTCMNFVRSMVAVGAGQDCTFGYAEQLNQLTHWIDGSNVYGSNLEEQRALRTGRGGLLKFSGSAPGLPPINPFQGGDCEAAERGAKCYLAGDSRVNEQPGLTAIHTLWLRQHNRVAQQLQQLHRRWSDEAVFQETRRIIIAQLQHITYNEWLAIVVGPRFMQSFGINVRQSGFSFDYNPNFNPNMNNEFSTAAYRFGHSLVQGTLRLFSKQGSVSEIQLRHHFNSPHLIQRDGRFDDIVRSFTQLASQSFDNFVTQDLSNHLFQMPRFNFGMDLMSINIHRGREHGIATYNDIRAICGLRRARSFNDLNDQIPSSTVQNLARIYESVDDIDLFVGGMAERPVNGGLLGWTFLCIVGDQFARLKKGDRYFYDLGGQPGSFNEAQLQEIRKTSWARILCDNSDVEAVQPLAFRQTISRFNQPQKCNSGAIPTPNLQAWQGVRPDV